MRGGAADPPIRTASRPESGMRGVLLLGDSDGFQLSGCPNLREIVDYRVPYRFIVNPIILVSQDVTHPTSALPVGIGVTRVDLTSKLVAASPMRWRQRSTASRTIDEDETYPSKSRPLVYSAIRSQFLITSSRRSSGRLEGMHCVPLRLNGNRWAQRLSLHNVDGESESFGQAHLYPAHGEDAADLLRIDLDHHVHIAVRPVTAPGHGTKNRSVVDPHGHEVAPA